MPSFQPSLLPPLTRAFGAVTQARLVRLCLLYLLLALSGAALAWCSDSGHWQAFGLGLMLPGGGFFAHFDGCTSQGTWHLVAALSAMALFVLSLGVWFGTGNILAPPATWLGAALYAAGMNHGPANARALVLVSALVGLLAASVGIFTLLRFFLARRQRGIDNAYLLGLQSRTDDLFGAAIPDLDPEMSLEDLQRLRFGLDRALQAVDQFNGFEWLDQFQTAAVRYQLNFLAYGIAMTQARFTPAFGGYMHEAQIGLLDKQAQHKVWAYWKLENLWGNLSADPDPLARENIMYTGFVALQMALFEASTGRQDFRAKGRYALVHPAGARYAYHDASLIERLEKEFAKSDFFLIACEPNWIYPLCNTIGASAILAHDAQRGLSKWRQHEVDFRRHLEAEFLDAFGRYIPCRSARTGLPLPAIGGAMPLAMPCFFLNAIAPDLALRQWMLLRRRLFDRQARFRRRAFWPIDTGNYGFSRASAYTATALAAAEMGDREVHAHCMLALEDECPTVLKDGVRHRPKASVWAHGVEIMARAAAKNGFRDLVAAPLKPRGPRLEGLAYPDVLVASAHAEQDSLRAVLYVGVKDGIHALGLAGLHPHRRYGVNGATTALIEADERGEARFSVRLAGRTMLTIFPEGGR